MTQAGVTDVQRAAFERWVQSEVSKGYLCSLADEADVMWLAWQAALSIQPKAVSLESLKALQAYWCDWNGQELDEENEPAETLRRFPGMSIVYKYEDLTAIIGDNTKADISADRNWIAGAQWGFGRGLENDNASLAEAIEARQRDIKAAKAIIGEGD